MRGLGYTLAVIGVIVFIVGLVNHFVIKANPFPHTSTIALAAGAILAIVGVALSMMRGQAARA